MDRSNAEEAKAIRAKKRGESEYGRRFEDGVSE
jgi:hypothetical protein